MDVFQQSKCPLLTIRIVSLSFSLPLSLSSNKVNARFYHKTFVFVSKQSKTPLLTIRIVLSSTIFPHFLSFCVYMRLSSFWAALGSKVKAWQKNYFSGNVKLSRCRLYDIYIIYIIQTTSQRCHIWIFTLDPYNPKLVQFIFFSDFLSRSHSELFSLVPTCAFG